jgi:hypothetical protein
MNKQFFLYLLLLFSFCCSTPYTYAQGCSDAGFCTMGAMKPDQKFNKKAAIKLRSIEISQYYGYTHFKDNIWATNLDINIGLSPKSTLQIKMPYQYVSGLLADTQGFGDISLSFTRNIFSTENTQINITIGAKIPTNNSNKTTQKNNTELPLPMYYQTSLGTYDLVLGGSLLTKNWLFGIGIQQVLSNDNENTFLWGKWRTFAPEFRSISDKYHVSKNLARGTDIMLRIERNFRFSNYNFSLGILPIYRINKDILTSFDQTLQKEVRGEFPATDGIACSLLLGTGYNFSVKSGIKCMFGYNLLTLLDKHYRINPDGLSREVVITAGYEFRF